MPAPLSTEVRLLIISSYDDGRTQDEIADIFNITQPTVSRLIKKFNTEGHVFSKKAPGRIPAIKEEDYLAIKNIVAGWKDISLKQLALEIAAQLNKPVLSESTMCRLLAKLNLRLKKSPGKLPNKRGLM